VSRSSTTCEKSEDVIGQLTLFTEDSHVRTSASQGNRRGLKGSAPASGSRCSELLVNLDPLSSLLRTCVERSISPSIPCVPVWETKATKSGLSSYQHLRLVRPTKGKGSSSSDAGAMWPTPSTRDYKGANGDAHFLSRKRPHMSQLPNAVRVMEASGLHLARWTILSGRG